MALIRPNYQLKEGPGQQKAPATRIPITPELHHSTLGTAGCMPLSPELVPQSSQVPGPTSMSDNIGYPPSDHVSLDEAVCCGAMPARSQSATPALDAGGQGTSAQTCAQHGWQTS